MFLKSLASVLLVFFALVDAVPVSNETLAEFSASPPVERYFVQFFFKTNWHRASQFCRYHGMHLASITSAAEQRMMEDQLRSFGLHNEIIWISANDILNKGKFSWASSGRPVTYTNWGPGEPNNSGGQEDCVCLWTNLLWNDVNCDYLLYFVCEP